jgi:preprotein translocase subunit SecE
MGQGETTIVTPQKSRPVPAHEASDRGGAGPRPPGREGGLFEQYKPDQGKMTRTGTFIGLGLLIAWGALFVKDRLAGYEDSGEWWGLLITPGIPILLAVAVGVVAWRVVFANRKASDFMIATEGEMKKVSWSSRREVLGSTKVVIVFTILLSVLLFVIDVVFQYFFRSIGVLKV